MPRSNIDRLKKLQELSVSYAKKFRENERAWFHTDEAQKLRDDLNKRYVELEALIEEAVGPPLVSIFRSGPLNAFYTAYSSANDVAAYHAIKSLPDFLSRAIAFHGGKKAKTESKQQVKPTPSEAYVKPDNIDRFKQKSDGFNYKKLVLLLESLNRNYAAGDTYACYFLVKAILNHIPPLLGFLNYKELASNYNWGSQARKNYALKLKDFFMEADDATHSVISHREDQLEIDNFPSKTLLDTILEECLSKTQTSTEISRPQTPSESNKTVITLKDEAAEFGRWSAMLPTSSFKVEFTVDNYSNSRPNFIENVVLKGTNADGSPWVSNTFKFDGLRRDERFKISEHDKQDQQVYLAIESVVYVSGRPEMPDLDRDTVTLEIYFADKTTQTLKIRIRTNR